MRRAVGHTIRAVGFVLALPGIVLAGVGFALAIPGNFVIGFGDRIVGGKDPDDD